MRLDGVQTSCGFAVPLMDQVGERDKLIDWAERRGDDGLAEYWAEKNSQSLDGIPGLAIEPTGVTSSDSCVRPG